MARELRVLLIEDDQADAFLIEEMLQELTKEENGGLASIVRRVVRLEDALRCLSESAFDILISDLGLPDSQGVATVQRLMAAAGRLPVVVLTGLANHEVGLEAVNAGAQDFLVKGQVSAELLVRSIRYAIERKRIENEKEQIIQELQAALAKVKLLRGLLPICAACKKIRDDKGYWEQIESYIMKHSDAEFSHSICPECARQLYPDLYPDKG